MFGDGVVNSFGEQLTQHVASDLALVSRAHHRCWCVTRTKARDVGLFAVLLANAIESSTDLRGLDLDLVLFASWGDVYQFSFHLRSIRNGAKGGARTPTPFGTRS